MALFPYDFDWGYTGSDVITSKKVLITLATGVKVVKHFSSLTLWTNKERLFDLSSFFLACLILVDKVRSLPRECGVTSCSGRHWAYLTSYQPEKLTMDKHSSLFCRCMTTDNFCFNLQNRMIQTSQTGGQWYSDTSPFSIIWFYQYDTYCKMLQTFALCHIHLGQISYSVLPLLIIFQNLCRSQEPTRV